MNNKFHIEFKRSNGNLHVLPQGDFDGTSAWELLNFLHSQYTGEGNVFVDTSRLRLIHPFGCSTFKCRLNRNRLPAHRLFFKGENGVQLAPEGSKVIAKPDKSRLHCSGKCANCQCSGKLKLH
jgi:hypothetical protein